jgi:hypothetical protein
MPVLGVMRFDRSIWTPVDCAPSGPGGVTVTCGSEISSATNGSSVKIVAGKNRCPAQPCASAAEFADKKIAAAATTASDRKGFMSELPLKMPMRRGRKAASASSQRIRQAQTIGGARER